MWELEAAAVVAHAGMDVPYFLHLTDRWERLVLLLTARKVIELRELDDKNRATRIANAVWSSVG